LLPSCSSLGSPGPSGLPSRAASTVPFLRIDRASPLLHFDATFSVLLLRLPQPVPSHVDHDPVHVVPRISYPALQHLRIVTPIFSLPVSQKRRETVALAPRCLTLGFGYPLDESSSVMTLGSLFQLPTLLGFALQSFSPPGGSRNPSESLFRPGTSRQNPNDLAPVLRRFPPTQKAVPLFAPQCLARVGTFCSLELSNLAGSPSLGLPTRSIFLLVDPSRSYPSPTLRYEMG